VRPSAACGPISTSKKILVLLALTAILVSCGMATFFNNEEISVTLLNCNSLNMSASAKWNQTLKICGITKLKSDVIFLSDVRLSNKNLISAGGDISKSFINNLYEKYDMYYNSTKNRRGVAILFKNSLQYEILEQKNSECENIMLVKAKIKNHEIVLISVYGPNNVDMEFFTTLNDYLLDCGNIPVIMGGDWNCTGSCAAGADNIDCLNMLRPPNITHSRRLSEVCEIFDLSDPYRYLYPDMVDFTYIPRAAGNKNRSRLDFFLVSDTLLDYANECKIADYLQNKLFDHKAVTLYFNNKKGQDTDSRSRPTISNKELSDDLLPFLVKTSVSETYLIHAADNVIHGIRKENLVHTCGTIRNLIRECGPPIEYRLGENVTEENTRVRARKLVCVEFLAGTLNLHHFETLNLTVTPDLFMETLLNNLKNDVISHQSFIRKVKKEKINCLIKTLSELKNNFLANEEEIFAKEKEVNLLIDCDIRSELKRFRHYNILHTEKM
jgi:exonuclease III